MNGSLEAKLIECLELLDAGEHLDRLLARYPDDAAELRPMLEVATRLSELKMAPSVATQRASRQAFLAEAETLRSGVVRPRRQSWFGLRGLLRFSASLVILLVILAMGLVALSPGSLPGDALYGTKIWVEETRLTLARDEVARETLRQAFGRRRQEEVSQLLVLGREESVRFGGLIEAVRGEQVSIAGILVEISENTTINGDLQEQALAEVAGRSSQGMVLATRITIVEAPLPAPEPEPSPVPPTNPTPPPTRMPASTPDPEPDPTPPSTPAAGGQGSGLDTTDDSHSQSEDGVSNDASSSSSGDDNSGSDNSGPGSDNSGSGSDDSDGDDSGGGDGGSGDDNSGSGSNNSGSGNSGTGSGDDGGDSDDDSGSSDEGSSGSGSDDGEDNSGSGSGNSGSGGRDDDAREP